MSNNIDLDELIKSVDPKKEEEKSEPAEASETPKTDETAEPSETPKSDDTDKEAQEDNSELEKKLSKANMAKLIAQNLSQRDEEEEAAVQVKKPQPKKKASEVQKNSKSASGSKGKSSGKKKKKKKQSSNTAAIVFGFLGGFVIVACLAFYIGGLVITNGKFLPNTTVNGKLVGMMTAEQVTELMTDDGAPTEITIIKHDGNNVKIPLADIGYKLDTAEKVQSLLDKKDTALWFMSLFNATTYTLEDPTATFDSEKLKNAINAIAWGDSEPTDAYITSTEDGFTIVPDKPGEKIDTDKLWAYVLDCLNKDQIDIRVEESGAYIQAAVTVADLQDKLDSMNSVSNVEITIDFDYTTEILSGKDFARWVTFNDDGSYTVDPDMVMGYVEELARKYDTYGTDRKFHATLQGDITVGNSDDAKYGWWIYQDETAEMLVKLIEKGESVTVDPIYYYTKNADGSKGYIYSGREEARTAGDDIGNTYVEIDLTAQTLWYYEEGELKHTCGIVSGQLTPAARKTLPGIYKVWFKAKNYHMKSSNSAGESWESDCAYWTRVAIVGIGLHDSQWRGNAVGGQIYKTNGSHGCINMTLKDAKYIYDNVDYGTPVVMYY